MRHFLSYAHTQTHNIVFAAYFFLVIKILAKNVTDHDLNSRLSHSKCLLPVKTARVCQCVSLLRVAGQSGAKQQGGQTKAADSQHSIWLQKS